MVLVALAAAGCGGGTPAAQGLHPATTHAARYGTTTSSTSNTSSTSTTSSTQPPVTPMVWSPCQGDLQCGTLVVPLDYAHPDGPTIGIAVARHPAEDPAARIGSLVIDPGGPGVSGVDDMANELSSLTPQLLDDFDIVLFDPRGVERSDPVSCGTETGSAPSDPAPATPGEQTATIAGLRQFAAACEKNSPNLLPHVGSVDVARDMDRLRQALGDGGLTYMGQSYGTLLGLTYAALFPTHIRAMVLDSVIDPALSFDQITQGQADGFESTLNAFFAWCAGSTSCSWHPGPDPTAALLALLSAAATSPAPAGGGGVAGAGQLYDAVLDSLYSQSEWPQLGAALSADAARQRCTGGRALEPLQHRRVVQRGRGCHRHRLSRPSRVAPPRHLWPPGRIARVVRAGLRPTPGMGRGRLCGLARAPTRKPGPVAAPGSPPILVVGTTSDPATPYAWAVSVAKELDRGVLLTHDGDDHVAYFYSACVRADVQTYLVSGQTPAPGTVCGS